VILLLNGLNPVENLLLLPFQFSNLLPQPLEFLQLGRRRHILRRRFLEFENLITQTLVFFQKGLGKFGALLEKPEEIPQPAWPNCFPR